MARRVDNGGGCGWLILIVGLLYVLGKCGGTGGPSASDSWSDRGSPSRMADGSRYVVANTLNCRQAPQATASVVMKLTFAELVTSSEEMGSWTRISSPLRECWVASRYLSRDKPVAVSRAVSIAERPAKQSRKPRAPQSAAVRSKIIEQSIDSYPGNCPCPYNTDRAGRRCGGRSAWSRGGGYAPKCYPGDVTKADIEAFRL